MPDAVALAGRGIDVEIDGTRILHDVSVAVPATGLTALLGPNGSGKSTLLRVLAGIERTARGDVLLAETGMASMRRRERALQLAFVEQEAATELALSAWNVAMLGRLPHQGMLGGATHEDRQIVTAALERTGAIEWRERTFASLSGGERQRVRLAAALAQQPRVLLLDEPTNHLDVRAALETMSLLRSLADDGVTVLAALHDLTLAGWADHAVVLAEGAVVASGPVAAVLTPATIQETYGVRAHVGPHPLTGRLSVQTDLLP